MSSEAVQRSATRRRCPDQTLPRPCHRCTKELTRDATHAMFSILSGLLSRGLPTLQVTTCAQSECIYCTMHERVDAQSDASGPPQHGRTGARGTTCRALRFAEDVGRALFPMAQERLVAS